MSLAAPSAHFAQTPNALACVLKAAGDSLRLAVLRVLLANSYGVLELCTLFDVKQPSMSHHLKVMAAAGLVSTRKEGNSIFYRRAQLDPGDPNYALKQAIFNSADALPLNPAVSDAIAEVNSRRAKLSQAFFSDNAKRFKLQQDLIADFSTYGGQVAAMLDASPVPSPGLALEIGPGAGEFLAVLARRFRRVIAIDNSPDMLEQAADTCRTQGLGAVELVLDDNRYCAQMGQRADCAVMNMVLHHSPEPSAVFAQVSAALKPKGVLIVCDLCNHNQDWVRAACGDLWLGFEPIDLSLWAAENAMSEGQSSYFALRNGFQIQIRQFIKK